MKRLTILSIFLLGAILLSACATSGRGASWPGLAADANNAYLADGSLVYAVRLSDGAKAWQFPERSAGQIFYSAPVLTPGGQLLVGSAGNDYGLYSLDPATGKEKWASPFKAGNGFFASPLVVGDAIYAPNNDGTLYVLKLATGEKLWSLPLSRSLWGAPVTDGKLIFVTSLDHFVYAVDPQTQQIAWKTNVGGSVPDSPALSVDGATLYVGSFQNKLTALNVADGQVRWTADTKGWVWGAPAVDGDVIYAADINGYVYSFGAQNGRNAWPEVRPDGPITGSPLLLGDGVFVGTESGTAFAFDRNGDPLWPNGVQIGGKIYSTPVLAGDKILVSPMSTDFLLAALNSKTGNIVWKFTGK